MSSDEPARSNVFTRLRTAKWNEIAFLLPVGVACLALWLFLELADDAPEGDYQAFEDRILLAFRDPTDPGRGLGPHWLPYAARDVTALGGASVMLLVSALVAGFLFLRGFVRNAVIVVAAVLGSFAVNSALKHVFERPRPSAVPHLVEEWTHSFPSGHTMVSTAAYLTIGVLLSQSFSRRRERAFVVGCAILLSLLIGTSRLYLGVHHPTDVLAGWSAGTFWALMCWGVAVWLQRRRTRL